MTVYKFISDYTILGEIEPLVVDFMGRYEISDTLRNRLIITSLEALTNSIRHGNGGNRKKTVKYVIEKIDDKVKIVVEDEGKGFDYQHLPDPTSAENLLKLSGRGVFLMKKLADGIVYNSKGNRVELYFNI